MFAYNIHIHSSIIGYLGYFYILIVVNNAVRNAVNPSGSLGARIDWQCLCCDHVVLPLSNSKSFFSN